MNYDNYACDECGQDATYGTHQCPPLCEVEGCENYVDDHEDGYTTCDEKHACDGTSVDDGITYWCYLAKGHAGDHQFSPVAQIEPPNDEEIKAAIKSIQEAT